MHISPTLYPETKLVGITGRTNNKQEANPATSRIAALMGQYWQQAIAMQIPHRKNPGITFAAYTEYESDYTGDYTYFIGEEVSLVAELPASLHAITIPAGRYAKCTTEPGPMPMVLVQAWHRIWQLSPEELGGERRYHTDFELYDHRALNPLMAVLDVMIGLKS
jgi:predicted transcriptional regulator YdeE